MFPRIIPFPVLVPLMVRVLLPVVMEPFTILMVGTDTLFRRVTFCVPVDLLMVRVLKVFVPLIVASVVPVKLMVPVLAVKLPLLIQLPAIVCVKEPALKVVAEPMVRLPLMVAAPAAVFTFPFETVRLW